MKNYFSCETVSDRIRRLIMPGDVYAYLVEGDERAALIDTGCGLGDLKSYVETLTEKPIMVLLTHGHVDHAPGAVQFEDVFMSGKDMAVYQRDDALTSRSDFLNGTAAAGQYDTEDFIPEHGADHFRPLQDGISFDLGNLQIVGYACPGHTPGSFVFLIVEEKALLLGDACNSGTFLFESFSLGINSYEDSLKRLLNLVQGRYEYVLLSHGQGTPSIHMIEENIRVCEDIKAGVAESMPYKLMGYDVCFAYRPGRLSELGEIMGDIVYDPKRIFE